jgi:hypothetical protein
MMLRIIVWAERVRAWLWRWKLILSVLGILIFLAGQIGFTMFILEEAAQQLVFSAWFFEDAKDHEGMARVARELGAVNRTGSIVAHWFGWLNPLAYVSYTTYFDVASAETARAISAAARAHLVVTSAQAAEKLDVGPGEVPYFKAGDYVGQEVTVVFAVREATLSSSGRAFFLNSYGSFTAVAFNRSLFAELATLRGKQIAVTGTVKMYRGAPEIIIESLSQVKRK